MLSVMKITGFGPTMGPQTLDDDDQQELEIAGLLADEAAPVEDLGDSLDPSEEQQTQEGLARLLDFLKAKQAKRSRKRSGFPDRREMALSAYHKILDGEDTLVGTNIKRRV